MASPLAAVGCQLDYGQFFDGVPWLKNYRLLAHFNLLILTHMPLINVLNGPGPGTAASPGHSQAGCVPGVNFLYVEY